MQYCLVAREPEKVKLHFHNFARFFVIVELFIFGNNYTNDPVKNLLLALRCDI